jgi:hypothetical protein
MIHDDGKSKSNDLSKQPSGTHFPSDRVDGLVDWPLVVWMSVCRVYYSILWLQQHDICFHVSDQIDCQAYLSFHFSISRNLQF